MIFSFSRARESPDVVMSANEAGKKLVMLMVDHIDVFQVGPIANRLLPSLILRLIPQQERSPLNISDWHTGFTFLIIIYCFEVDVYIYRKNHNRSLVNDASAPTALNSLIARECTPSLRSRLPLQGHRGPFPSRSLQLFAISTLFY